MARQRMTSKTPCMYARAAASAIVATASVALLAPAPRAQEAPVPIEQPRELSLEDLLNLKITTASLRPQEVREVPATTYIVTEEDFRAYGYRDLKDILRNLPGIDYVWPGSHLFGGQRGFSSQWELTKLLINGREANAMTNDAPFVVNQFNLTGVKRVEIVQGPASVLYGPEAFSGIINIITKDADNSPEESEVTGIVGGGDRSSLDGNGAFHTVAKRGPMALSVGGYLDGGRGPDYGDFLKTREYAEFGRDARVFLLENGYPYRNDMRNHKFNADLTYSPMERARFKAGALYVQSDQGGGAEPVAGTYNNRQSIHEQLHFHASGEYTFAAAPVKATLSLHHMGEDFWNRFNGTDTAGNFPPYLAAFNFEDTRLDVANLQVDYFPSFIDNYFLAGVGTRDTRVGEPAFTGFSANDTLPGHLAPMAGRYIYPPTGVFAFLRPVLWQNRRAGSAVLLEKTRPNHGGHALRLQRRLRRGLEFPERNPGAPLAQLHDSGPLRTGLPRAYRGPARQRRPQTRPHELLGGLPPLQPCAPPLRASRLLSEPRKRPHGPRPSAGLAVRRPSAECRPQRRGRGRVSDPVPGGPIGGRSLA